MLTFFRKIRRKLANQNKFVQYSRYAIGEIVLVVIGILIALSINNWNEERKVRDKSLLYTNKIVNNIIADTININQFIERSNIAESNTKDYFSFFNQGTASLNRIIDSSRNVSANLIRYFPVNNTYLDMQSSGNSNLLNEMQRDVLFTLFSEQEQLTIIIEKMVVNILSEQNLSNKYLGYPADFYEKIGTHLNEENKKQLLIHQNLNLYWKQRLYYYIEQRGNRIKEQSNKAIDILNPNFKQ